MRLLSSPGLGRCNTFLQMGRRAAEAQRSERIKESRSNIDNNIVDAEVSEFRTLFASLLFLLGCFNGGIQTTEHKNYKFCSCCYFHFPLLLAITKLWKAGIRCHFSQSAWSLQTCSSFPEQI